MKNLLQCYPTNHPRCSCSDDAVKISHNGLLMFEPHMCTEIQWTDLCKAALSHGQ